MYSCFAKYLWLVTVMGTNFSVKAGIKVFSFTTTWQVITQRSLATQHLRVVFFSLRVRLLRSSFPWCSIRMSCPRIALTGISTTIISARTTLPSKTRFTLMAPAICKASPVTPASCIIVGFSGGLYSWGILSYVVRDTTLVEAPVSTRKWTGSPRP